MGDGRIPIKIKSVKSRLIIYLICFAGFLAVTDRDFAFLFAVILAVAAALTTESVVLYFKTKTIRITESAIISGLIVGCVISSSELWWKFLCASSVAILSKHLIHFRKRHIFNPAAFGLFLTLILLGASTQWKGTYLWYVIIPFGLYFAYKTRKAEILLGYAVFFLLLFGAQALVQKVSLLGIFGYLNYFYIFVMVIEPRTSPVNKTGKFIFGAGIATLIFVLTQAGVKFEVELFSLLAMNAAFPLVDKLSPKQRRAI